MLVVVLAGSGEFAEAQGPGWPVLAPEPLLGALASKPFPWGFPWAFQKPWLPRRFPGTSPVPPGSLGFQDVPLGLLLCPLEALSSETLSWGFPCAPWKPWLPKLFPGASPLHEGAGFLNFLLRPTLGLLDALASKTIP